MTSTTYQASLLCVILAPLPLAGLLCRPCPPPRLDVSATVNARPGASTPPIRAGSPVVVDYRVTNNGGTRLVDLRITEPGALGGAVSCDGGGSSVVLRRGASVDCVGRLTALPGTHAGTATVSAHADQDGDSDDDDGDDGDDDDQTQVSTSAAVGYQGVASSVAVAEHVLTKPDAGGGQVTLTYVITNTGSASLFDFTASDAVLPSGAACPQPGSGLAPGMSLTCTGTTQLAPGTYHSAVTVSADDRTTTVGPSGESVPPPKVTANAAADFQIVAVPTPPPRPPTPPPTPPPTKPPAPTTPPPPPPTLPASAPPPPPSTPQPSPTPPPQPSPTSPPPTPPPLSATTPRPPEQKPAALASRPGLKTPLFLLVMMMPAAGAAAVLAARRK
ncbi:MAG: hypothetical protein HOW97_23410 [Catenulispora sp.]|nr:hypothetical protein [Catenulispora sp.]